MVLLKAIAVALPTSLAVIVALVGCWDPGVTMLGLSKHPSRKTLLSLRALTTLARTFSVTSWHFWMEWVPSDKISGSTIGTNPLA